jgi:glycosyltransferase involved in cell wall biosynthesis
VHGLTGLHVPPRDPAALAAALAGLLAAPERRAELGAAGRRRALDRFGWDRIAAATLGVYEQLTGVRAARMARSGVNTG